MSKLLAFLARVIDPDHAAAVIKRAGHAAWQAAGAVVGAAQFDVLTADWKAVGTVALNAAVLSVAKSNIFGVPEEPTSRTIRARLHQLRPADPDDLDVNGDDFDHDGPDPEVPDPADLDDQP